MTNVIITMAGFGRRFLDAGYTVPKYRIEVHGRSLFAWSMLSLSSFIKAGAEFVFVVRAVDEAADFIEREAAALDICGARVLEIGAPTDGQATTAMLAAPCFEGSAQPMLIYNIDTFVHPVAIPISAVRGEGWIPCFSAPGDHWSFARADAEGRVSELREKTRISDHATVGLYWFRSFDLYADSYRAYYAETGRRESGERYVAPLYNYLLLEGRAVFIHHIPNDAVIPLGVPTEVESFRRGAAPQLTVRR